MAERRILQASTLPRMKTRSLVLITLFGLFMVAVTWYYVVKVSQAAEGFQARAELPDPT